MWLRLYESYFRINEEQQRCFLVHLEEQAQQQLDRKVRNIITAEATKVVWGKIAIIGAKAYLRMFAKIAIKILKKDKDTKFFDSEKEAIDWLQSWQCSGNGGNGRRMGLKILW